MIIGDLSQLNLEQVVGDGVVLMHHIWGIEHKDAYQLQE
jgi:hypothetical protein